jgi:hypothetical protein
VRLGLAVVGSIAAPVTAAAGTVTGKLDLPPAPELAPMAQPGFVARSENALQPPQLAPLAPFVFIVLDGQTNVAPPQVNWDLVGDSFVHPVVAAMAGADVVIKNASKTEHLLGCDDPKVMANELLNPNGAKTIRVEANKTYVFRDPEAPYVSGRLVTVSTPYIGYIDAAGKFDIPDVPDGTYHVRVYYKDGWLDVEQAVTMTAKIKTESITVKVATLKPAAPAK